MAGAAAETSAAVQASR